MQWLLSGETAKSSTIGRGMTRDEMVKFEEHFYGRCGLPRKAAEIALRALLLARVNFPDGSSCTLGYYLGVKRKGDSSEPYLRITTVV